MVKTTYLTKSKFTHCLDCLTKLYYATNEDSPRYLIDQQKLIVKHYYCVYMGVGGSNSIEDVLRAVLNESEALLRYCELDTQAMVMIYEHWELLKNQS